MIKFARGQVWYCDDKGYGAVGTEIQKSRPWLILSDTKFNEQQVTCVPITHNYSGNLENYQDYSVSYYDKDDKCYIKCTQIFTKDVSRFSMGKSEYMYTLPDSIMDKVEAAISKYLVFKNTAEYTIEQLEFFFNSIIEERKKKLEDIKYKHTLEASKSISMLAERISEEATEIVEKETEEDMYIDSEKLIEASADKTERGSRVPIIKSQSGRVKWSEKLARQFINDYRTCDKSYVANLYGISEASVASTAQRLRSKYSI